MTKAATPLAVYYDHSCPICRGEIFALKSVDTQDALHLIDCSANDFDNAAARAQGIDQETLKSAMHVRDANGHWHVKADAFIAMYETVGFDTAAALLKRRGVRSLFERVYPLFVKHRHKLKYTGAHKLMPWLIRRAAKKQARAAVSCHVDAQQTNKGE